MEYLALKQVHVACVVLAYAGSCARGVWMIRDSAMLRRRCVKVLPHVNDTLLLAAAIALAVMLRQLPVRARLAHRQDPGACRLISPSAARP